MFATLKLHEITINHLQGGVGDLELGSNWKRQKFRCFSMAAPAPDVLGHC